MKHQYPFSLLLLLMGTGVVFQQCTSEQTSAVNEEDLILHAVEEIRIGKLDGEDEYVFGSVNEVAVGKNGEIFVVDRQVPVIRIYDTDGNFLRNVGRKGRGPGEYQRILGMHISGKQKVNMSGLLFGANTMNNMWPVSGWKSYISGQVLGRRMNIPSSTDAGLNCGMAPVNVVSGSIIWPENSRQVYNRLLRESTGNIALTESGTELS